MGSRVLISLAQGPIFDFLTSFSQKTDLFYPTF